MLKRLYDKSRIWFSVAFIIAYCVLMSVSDALSLTLGIEKVLTFPLGLLLSILLFLFLKRHGLLEEYGLCRAKVPAKGMLYYIPLMVLLTVNLWYGVSVNLDIIETVLYILSMLCVGFLEEVIFRGLLFGALCEENKKTAVIVSSVTFGMGHIINLINGSGAELLPNLLQVIYATAAGFMFVMVYCKTRSLIVCILTHGIFNALSVFSKEPTAGMHIVSSIALTLLSVGYALYLAYSMRPCKNKDM